LLLIESQSTPFRSALNYNSPKRRLDMRNLAVAVRALDPPEGGAERSVAALINGLLDPGPGYDGSTDFPPFSEVDMVADVMDGWNVSVIQGAVDSEPMSLLDARARREVCKLGTESVFSGLAWRLRSKATGHSNATLLRFHLKRANAKFGKVVGEWLDRMPDKTDVGLTQLSWSVGAADSFSSRGIPYVVFIRDELPFRFPDFYSDAISKAACVCAAGNGLGDQIRSLFDVQRVENIPLPIDYRSRFGNEGKVDAAIKSGRSAREAEGTIDDPRFAIVGLSPETGLSTYTRLISHLEKSWPEASFDLYGPGQYVEGLAKRPNVTVRGFVSAEEIFPKCDVHIRINRSFGTWGRVTNEAGIFRVPTVSNSVGSQPESVGKGGVIVGDHNDLLEFEGALRKCWEERVNLGELAFQHSSISDHRRSVSILRSVLESL